MNESIIRQLLPSAPTGRLEPAVAAVGWKRVQRARPDADWRLTVMARPVRLAAVLTVFGVLVTASLMTISVQRMFKEAGPPLADIPASASSQRDCYRHLARKYYSLNPRETGMEAEAFRRYGGRLLTGVVRALDRLELRHWLGSGTLLGFARQCELVPAMGDVDIEVAVESMWKRNITVQKVKDAVAAEGVHLLHSFGIPSDSQELAFMDKNGLRLDLFFSYPLPDGQRWIGGIDTPTLQKYKWTYPDFELCWALLDGIRVGVPCDPIGYLRAFYGPDWASPLKGTWDYRTGHPNVKKNGHWPEERRAEVFQSFNS